jgi:hypothetical protein
LDDPKIAESAELAEITAFSLDPAGCLHCSIYYSSNYIYCPDDLDQETEQPWFPSPWASKPTTEQSCSKQSKKEPNGCPDEDDETSEAEDEELSFRNMGRKLSVALGLDTLDLGLAISRKGVRKEEGGAHKEADARAMPAQ